MVNHVSSLDERRLQRCEDELAIRNLIARYGLAADCGDVSAAMDCYSEQAEYTVSAPESGRTDGSASSKDLVMQGRFAIGEMLRSDLHQSLLPNCAHLVHSLVVSIGSDTARATGYSQIFRQEGSAINTMRVAVNRWILSRYSSGWLIDRRESRILGEQAAQDILRSQ